MSLCAGSRYSYSVIDADTGGWAEMLSSIGLTAGETATADVVVVPHRAIVPAAEWAWATRIERGTILILEGDSPLAQALGFRPNDMPHISVRSIEDLREPELGIVWEKAVDLPRFDIPAKARVFARERWQKAPLLAGFRKGNGAVLWVATPPAAPSRRPRLRAFPLSSAGAARSWLGGSAALRTPVGVFRFRLSLACRSRLLRGALAGGGN
jgi:hypothetical protein